MAVGKRKFRTPVISPLVILTFAAPVVITPGASMEAAQPSSNAASATQFVQRMKRFYQIVNNIEISPQQKSAAASLVQALELEIKDHPEKGKYLRYYLARAEDVAGEKEKSFTVALALANDLADPYCADARDLLVGQFHFLNGDRFIITSPKSVSQYGDYRARVLGEVYPCGRYAEGAVQAAAIENGSFSLLETRDPIVADCGDSYKNMEMFPEAIQTYRLAIGFQTSYQWLSPINAPIWMSMGDCYAAQGNFDFALHHYYKSLASGQALADITPRIKRAERAIAVHEFVPRTGPRPNPDVLDKIAVSLANTQLFNQAIEAANAAEKARKSPSNVLPDLHQRKAVWMKKVLSLTHEGIVVRGIAISADSIRAEETLTQTK